ncbi:GntR family transcriptional regulator [Pusillimonas noertemannii]|uniref:DNA-binding GntR family transcriptional regulator n=1 Tax=Pusillimonas noertemannii TaxID=305977 RepID=A0A2U1CMX9_9BURK|nr:GntR family transcriptional regulator [Pusillimonas noertemannii]NYT68675.1 GntR family transcriptional regulator [Pusillimonas noertemannii]PVY62307.1 DNA-binding GntR family transcriptional regulator [Pusillimonas noertemannii]TFL10718.1 GntR family transcriptional regulator [Pusillimonas noertemannii]
MSNLSSLVRSETLAQQGYKAIRRAIRDGKIPRGQFFSESTLAESLGVSRTPVREALLNLYRDGVVEIVPKRGYRLIDLDEAAISEIRLLRVALEQIVVERLCKTATAEDIAELRAILNGASESREDMYTIDEAFHIRMAEMAALHQIRRELLSVRGKMYLIASGARLTSLRDENVVREHAELVDALEQRDQKTARRVITDHVERSIDAFVAARAELLKQSRLDRLS